MIDPSIGTGSDAVVDGVEYIKADPEGMFGPWLMALIGLTFMMGILAIQTMRYFSTFGYESPGIFTLVVACVILSLVQWVIIVQGCWDWFVVHYGAWEVFVFAPWQSWTSPMINQIIVAVAQLFFAHRCYTLYGRNKLIYGGLIVGMLAAVGLFTVVSMFVALDSQDFNRISRWTIPALCVNLGTDLAITSLTIWKLGGHSRQNFSPNTDDVLRRLRNLTIEAAVPPAICALLNMAFYLSMGSKNLIFVWFAIMTPRFYVCSLMFTLNSRRTIRQTFNSPNDDETLSTHFEFSNYPSSTRKRQQTDTRRTTVVFATMKGATCAPNASIGLVDERLGGGYGDNRRAGDSEAGLYDDSLAGRGRSELQVDLDRWDKEAPLRSFSESNAPIRTGAEESLEPPPPAVLNQVGSRPSDPIRI